jgi:hypothetical protein
MRDLSWVRKQGQIVEREKKKMRQQVHLPLKEKLDWYAEVYEAFEQRLDDTESVFGPMRISEMIELEKRVRSINAVKKQV